MSDLYTLNKIFKDSVFVFGSPRFEAYRNIEPELSRLAKQQPFMLVAKINPEIHTTIAQSYNVLVWPTFILLHNGREVKRVLADNMEEVRELFGVSDKEESEDGSSSMMSGPGP